MTGPADSPQRANFITMFREGVDTGQPACIDPLPANLADSKMFPTIDPAQVQPAIADGEFVVYYPPR